MAINVTAHNDDYSDLEVKYLNELSKQYPTIASACTEIINLQAILNLPKGTEHVLSDIHGEAEQFSHVLKNGSGTVRAKIEDEFGSTMCIRDKKQLATLIYYPAEKLDLIEKEEKELNDWYKITLNRLIKITARCSSKYTRSKVRKALPKDFAYIIEELIYEKGTVLDKEQYYSEIVSTIIRVGRARAFIIGLCELIQRLVIDHLHIVGDIYDRGDGAVDIMDHLTNYHSVDIQWGNHDILWMGAASGNPACIATVIRLCARYGNLATLEEDYGINLMPLANFAMQVYANDPCKEFMLTKFSVSKLSHIEEEMEMRMHKAISIIQFKLEDQLIKRRPEYLMDKRLLLDAIDPENGTIMIEGKSFPLKDTYFPTIIWSDPDQLSEEENEVMERLIYAFKNCEKLQKHVRFLLKQGSLYLCYNNNLYYHACVPMNKDGSFKVIKFGDKYYSGKSLYEYVERNVRRGYYLPEDAPDKDCCRDLMWFAWCNEFSPVFGKDKMTTFERYFIEDKDMHTEHKDPYYSLIESDDAQISEGVCDKILNEFGLDTTDGHIINGHMPVKMKKGESPIKGNGKLFIIDGGFSKAYQKTTGIAGYTLVYNSYGLKLVTHLPFTSKQSAIIDETDIHEDIKVIEKVSQRKMVADTDNGKVLIDKIRDLELLLKAYNEGVLRENFEK